MPLLFLLLLLLLVLLLRLLAPAPARPRFVSIRNHVHCPGRDPASSWGGISARALLCLRKPAVRPRNRHGRPQAGRALATPFRVAFSSAVLMQLSSPSTGVAHDTMSRESFLTALQESAGCRPEFASLRPPFHAFSTGAHPQIVGGMTKCALRSLSRRCMPSVNNSALLAAQACLQADETFSRSRTTLNVLTTLPGGSHVTLWLARSKLFAV